MTVTDYNSTYSPLLIVKDTHLIPHLNAQLTIQSNTFDITYDSQWNSYARSLLPIPIIITCAAVLALLILWMAICCRVCFPACKCMPKVERMDTINSALIERTDSHMPVFRRVRFFYIAFFIFALFTLGADQAVIFGSNGLIDGVNTSKDSLNYLQTMFNTLVQDGDNLVTEGNTISQDYVLASPDCGEASNLLALQDNYFTYVSEYQSYVDPVPNQCSTASDNLDKYGVQYKNSSMWALYGSVLISLFLYVCGLYFKSTLFLQLSMVFVYLLLWTLILLCGVEMVILMGLADFCMAPATYVQGVVPTSITDITTYYATCVGENPMAASLDSAISLVQQEQNYITLLLQGDCPNNQYLIDAYGTLNEVLVSISNITTTIECPPTQSQFNDVLNNGLCDQSFRGLYTIWVGQYISVTSLFLATIFVCLLYQYFDPHWDINPAHIKKSTSSIALYDENNAINKPSDSSNEIYYNTSSLHTTGDNNLVSDNNL